MNFNARQKSIFLYIFTLLRVLVFKNFFTHILIKYNRLRIAFVRPTVKNVFENLY